jgi:sugar phosphate isomerase/epimerase
VLPVSTHIFALLSRDGSCLIHINDASGRGPGFGETKFTPVLKTLAKSAYKGYISVDVFEFDPDPQTIASRSIGYLKGILEG